MMRHRDLLIKHSVERADKALFDAEKAMEFRR